MPAPAWVLALTLALAAPAFANDVIIITDPQDGDPAGTVARVEYLNSAERTSYYSDDVIRQTDYGPVVLKVEVTGGDETLSVFDLPKGLYAYPWQIDVADGDSGIIFLREWLGG